MCHVASGGMVGTPLALLSPSLRTLDPIQRPSLGTRLSSGKILSSLLLVDKTLAASLSFSGKMVLGSRLQT